jgi:hypothetical protein
MRAECIGSFLADSGIWMPRVWDKPNYNFDSFGKVSSALMHEMSFWDVEEFSRSSKQKRHGPSVCTHFCMLLALLGSGNGKR